MPGPRQTREPVGVQKSRDREPPEAVRFAERRAAFAWEKVQNCGEKYAALAKAAPVLVMGNGLMQTLAFLQAKEEHHRLLARHVCEWLLETFHGQGEFVRQGDVDGKADQLFIQVMRALSKAEPGLYRRATEEALSLLRWIRQFASAVTS